MKILVAPRHPERFEKVRELIKDYGQDRVILIDQMGVLPTLYRHSKAAIVGGSFVSGVGGHDVFEPLSYDTPVIFGAHMHKQLELRSLALDCGAGFEANSDNLAKILEGALSKAFLNETKALKKPCSGHG